MGTLANNPIWVALVRHFEANAVLTGGPDCQDNLPLQDLADRTAYLKAQQDAHAAAADPHPQYLTAAEGEALIEARVGDFALDTGTANAKVVALNPAVTAYTGNFDFRFKNLILNGGAVTINFGPGAVPLVRDDGVALASGDLPAGMIVEGQYVHADGMAYITSMVISQGDARYVKLDGATGLIRTLTPAGGARIRELGDIPNAATVGGIEYGIAYNCNIDPATGAWAGRDVADICLLEKWSDVGGLKEFWSAPAAAAGVAPSWEPVFGVDMINKRLTGPASLMGHGQCRLVKSGANLVLQPYNGNKIMIGGAVYPIPAAGVTITPASLPAKTAGFAVSNIGATAGTYTVATAGAHGLSVGDVIYISLYTAPAGCPQMAFNARIASVPNPNSFTFAFGTATFTSGAATGGGGPLLYHYVYMNAGTMAIESAATGHSTDATTGVEIKTGDATRTLVGMSLGSFSDIAEARYVRSYFNRIPLKVNQSLQAARSTASTAWVETNAADRAQFLCWADEIINIKGDGIMSGNAAGAALGFCVAIDAPTGVVGVTSIVNTPSIGNLVSVPTFIQSTTLPEGFHILMSVFDTSSGIATAYGSSGVAAWS